jgi:hypothetical protein
MDSNAYRLSRIYGQGWKAAKEMLLDRPEGLDAASPPENPHETLEERTRWSKGFEDALRSNTGAHGSANIGSWRPSQRGNAWKPRVAREPSPSARTDHHSMQRKE